jgi:hypothetical protein
MISNRHIVCPASYSKPLFCDVVFEERIWIASGVNDLAVWNRKLFNIPKLTSMQIPVESNKNLYNICIELVFAYDLTLS